MRSASASKPPKPPPPTQPPTDGEDDLPPYDEYTDEELDRWAAEDSLYEFVQQAWIVLEPEAKFVHGRAMRTLCEHLEAVTNGEISQLLVNIPPGTAKSLVCNVFWPAWEWGPRNLPHLRYICASRAEKLSTRDSVKCRDLILSPWYQRNWGARVKLDDFQNEKTRFKNTARGERLIISVGAGATGERGDRLIVDDPHDAGEVFSDTKREAVVDPWWKQKFRNRVNDLKKPVRVVIMQRLHQEDLSGYLLKSEAGKWVHLCLPMRYEKKRHCVTHSQRTGKVLWEDWRTREGELLWPERFPEDVVQDDEKNYGEYGTAGQLQQRPTPAKGNLFRRTSWQPYCEYPGLCQCGFPKIPKRLDGNLTSWDCTFKDTVGTDRVAGAFIAWAGADIYVRDAIAGHWDFTRTCKEFQKFGVKHPEACPILVEDKANGPAVISTFKREIRGILAWNPGADNKLARAHAIKPYVDAGNVWLPAHAAWVPEFIEELADFPTGTFDDLVDAFTQGANYLKQQGCVVGIA